MRRALAVLAVAPPASAGKRSLLVNGDSLAEGTSRHAYQGDDVMRRYGSRLAHVIHVSLGNHDPRDVDGFRDAIAGVMRVAGRARCVSVLNWVRMVRRHPEWLARDGVHVSAAGYRARARAVARAVGRCP